MTKSFILTLTDFVMKSKIGLGPITWYTPNDSNRRTASVFDRNFITRRKNGLTWPLNTLKRWSHVTPRDPTWPNMPSSKLDIGNKYKHLHVINILMILSKIIFAYFRSFIVGQTWCGCFSSTDDWYGTLRRRCWCVRYACCCLWLRQSHFNFKPPRSRCSESDSYNWLKTAQPTQTK